MDGVLVDTGPIHYQSWVKMAEKIGKSFTKEFFNATFGQKSVPITRMLVGKKVDQKKVKKLADLKETYYREMVKDSLKPLPNTIDFIKKLRDLDFKLAIGSSGPPENVNLIVKALNIENCFDSIVTATDVQNGKPAPDVFLIAARNLKIPSENCVVIEDAPVGIEAALKAGMKCIALRTTHCNVELLKADMVVQNLSKIEVEDIIRLLKAN